MLLHSSSASTRVTDAKDRFGSIYPLQRPLLGPEPWALRGTAGLRTLPYRNNRPGAVLRHRGRIASPARPLVRQRGVREHVHIKKHADIGGDLMDMGRFCTDIGELNGHACRLIQS